MTPKEPCETESGIQIKRVYTSDDVRHELEPPGTLLLHAEFIRTCIALDVDNSLHTPGSHCRRIQRASYVTCLQRVKRGYRLRSDLPTAELGLESADRKAEGEDGEGPVMEIQYRRRHALLFKGIPLDKVSTSMTITPCRRSSSGVRNRRRRTGHLVDDAKETLRTISARSTSSPVATTSIRRGRRCVFSPIYLVIARSVCRAGMSYRYRGITFREAGSTAVQESHSLSQWPCILLCGRSRLDSDPNDFGRFAFHSFSTRTTISFPGGSKFQPGQREDSGHASCISGSG